MAWRKRPDSRDDAGFGGGAGGGAAGGVQGLAGTPSGETLTPAEGRSGIPPRRDYWPYTPMHAVVVIEGQEYWEWESVYVRIEEFASPSRHARFTCSEQEGIGKSFAALRIRPGDHCEIFLDGYLVITGQVSVRQVYYDARQHAVEIQVVGDTAILAKGSVISKTGEWKNTALVDLVRSAIGPYGLGLRTKGVISSEKFPRVASMPGEKVKEFIDKHANARNATTGETADGNFLLSGTIPVGGMDALIQGSNILIGRETIYNQAIASGQNFPGPGSGGTADASDPTGGGQIASPALAPSPRQLIGGPVVTPFADGDGSGTSGGSTSGGGGEQAYTTSGQRPGTDDDWGVNPTHQTYSQQDSSAGFSGGFQPSFVPSEIPAWSKDQMQSRGRIENNVDDDNQIYVYITVLGWQRPGLNPPQGQSGGLWEFGDMVWVDSDWLIMHRPLHVKAVTFQQDNESGSRTTLDLVNAAALKGQGQYPGPGS